MISYLKTLEKSSWWSFGIAPDVEGLMDNVTAFAATLDGCNLNTKNNLWKTKRSNDVSYIMNNNVNFVILALHW